MKKRWFTSSIAYIDYNQIDVLRKDKLSVNGYNKPYLEMILTFLFVIANLI